MSTPRTSLAFTVDSIPLYVRLCQQVKFSEQDLAILEHLSYGKKVAEIAQELGLTLSTVNKYLYLLREKVNVKDTTHLVCIAFRSGLIR